jgi:hypothetical protein
MLLVDQLEKLNETMAQILDVKRYDVSRSSYRRIAGALTSPIGQARSDRG